MNVYDETQRFQRLIKHWCPANLQHEGFPNTLMRAFMAATACCADMQRKLEGQDPIRPLNSYPNPMQGFYNVPTGFIDFQIKDGPVPYCLTVTIADQPVVDASLFRSGLERWMAVYKPGSIMRIEGANVYYAARVDLTTIGYGKTEQ